MKRSHEIPDISDRLKANLIESLMKTDGCTRAEAERHGAELFAAAERLGKEMHEELGEN